MKPKNVLSRTSALLSACAFTLLFSSNAAAQKSVYDVIPGSGPKKQAPAKSLPTVINNGDNGKPDSRNSLPVYTRKRRHLPPGQAKKIYGGSATDYAPGQQKKHRKHRHHFKKSKG